VRKTRRFIAAARRKPAKALLWQAIESSGEALARGLLF